MVKILFYSRTHILGPVCITHAHTHTQSSSDETSLARFLQTCTSQLSWCHQWCCGLHRGKAAKEKKRGENWRKGWKCSAKWRKRSIGVLMSSLKSERWKKRINRRPRSNNNASYAVVSVSTAVPEAKPKKAFYKLPSLTNYNTGKRLLLKWNCTFLIEIFFST